jgi:predicted dehydrogenase
MIFKGWAIAGLIGGVLMTTAGCTDGYGYSGVSLGYGGGGYYDTPYAGGYGGGYGYAPSYYGWYGDYYYPGTGGYVYDRYRRAHRWNDGQRRYWEGRRGNAQVRDNWQDFRRDVRQDRRDLRGDLRDNRQAYRDGRITRDQFRDGRQDARRDYRGDVRREARELRRENRAEGVRTPRVGRGGDWRGGRRRD